ncbi:MAG: TRAP transporter substrate-binding protein [Deferrisomatales bacterium]|nr:TRAP transporter substrate-binding protein [Deferrisomatales bacterium]
MGRFACRALLTLGLLALAGTAWSSPVSFHFATFIPPNEPGSEVGLWIEKELNETSGGRVRAQYFHSGQMGDAIEIAKKASMGTLQGAISPSTNTPDLDPKYGIATLAYLMDSYEKWEAFRKDDALRDELFLSTRSKGLRCLDFSYFGLYGLATTKPVSSLQDLRAMKMRTTQNRYPLAFWRAFGVNPVTMAWGDVFPALRQGVIDGTDQTRNVTRLRLADVTKNFTATDHMVGLFFLMVNERWWSGLDPEVRDLIAGVVERNFAKARQQSMELTENAIPELEKQGVSVIRLSPEEMERFRATQRAVWDQFEPEIGKDFLARVKAFAEKH